MNLKPEFTFIDLLLNYDIKENNHITYHSQKWAVMNKFSDLQVTWLVMDEQ